MHYELHPDNRNFTWAMSKSRPTLLSPAQLRQFESQGFMAYEDPFDGQTLQAVLAAIDPLEAQAEAELRLRPNQRRGISRAGEITFRAHLVLHNAALAALCKHPALLGLCKDLIGPDVRLYWEQSVYKKPGMQEDFPWHQDNGYTFVEPQQYLTCWIALNDATVDNGCPWIAPGLHQLGTLRHEVTEYGFRCLRDVEGAVPVPLRAGSIAVFSSLTPHRTGPNLTATTRKAYIVQYAPEGARIRRPDGTQETCDVEGRQFAVLRDGLPT